MFIFTGIQNDKHNDYRGKKYKYFFENHFCEVRKIPQAVYAETSR